MRSGARRRATTARRVSRADATAIDCDGHACCGRKPTGQELVGIGLKDIVAVAMPDAVLVADMSRRARGEAAVAALKAEGAPQAETFPAITGPGAGLKPWSLADRFQVKRIVVHPGAAL